MRRSPPKSTIADIPRDGPQAPNKFKSSAPAVVVLCLCGLVERMDRRSLNRFIRDIWARFDERDLAPLRTAMLRRRRLLAAPVRP